MVNWNYLQNATAPDSRPTPGWLFHEICLDVRNCPMDSSDVAEYLMQCVCSDQLNIQLKAVLVIKHLAAEVFTFQRYMQSCQGALRILQDIAAPPIVPQARNLEPLEVKTVRDATQAALDAITTPHTVETQTESAHLKERIQGFGNYEPPAEEQDAQKHTVSGQVTEFVADSIGDMVDDFREKGAVGALKDATLDALDLMLDGVDAVWGWVAGKSDSDGIRICQPQNQFPHLAGGAPGFSSSPGAFQPPPLAPKSASNHYAVAFGGGVVGANNEFLMSAPAGRETSATAANTQAAGMDAGVAASDDSAAAAPTAAEGEEPAPLVDLLSMDEPKLCASVDDQSSAMAAASVPDLLGDVETPESAPQASENMLDL
mmetsp:Transcript_87369/g.151267  ORF Transcript_87369/g.151267 Transcript_87369/m.151267 type:complete len:373 (-) Transcript_87369:51-1169(-)